jgi:hypothetical protein
MQISQEPVCLREFMNYNGNLTESIFYKDPGFPTNLKSNFLYKNCFRYHVTIPLLYENFMKQGANRKQCLILYKDSYQSVVREDFQLQFQNNFYRTFFISYKLYLSSIMA